MFGINIPGSAWAFLLGSGLVLGLGFSVYKMGSHHGASRVEAMWYAERAELQAAARQQENLNRELEREHHLTVNALEERLVQIRREHDETVFTLRSDYADRLRVSDERAARYREWAEGDASDGERLADRATGFDRHIVEGGRLVEALRAAIVLRDQQLRALGIQIDADRALIENR